MRTALSAIAIGVGLACACQLASAQTVTVTQQGYGNTSSTEQVGAIETDPGQPISTTATITQVGSNNHVGGPGATSGGIFQRDNRVQAAATVYQNGSGNNAGITQDGTFGTNGLVEARITQLGTDNDATITQYLLSASPVLVDQIGAGNRAHVEQGGSSADTHSRTTQNGTANQATVIQRGATFFGPEVTQNGDGNTALVISNNMLGGFQTIEQTGTMNSASSVQAGDADHFSIIGQLGTGNHAETNQTGNGQWATIDQNGSNNFASVTRASALIPTFNVNTTLIAQRGNDNRAFVRQAGDGYVANVNQVGSGNWTSIYQH